MVRCWQSCLSTDNWLLQFTSLMHFESYSKGTKQLQIVKRVCTDRNVNTEDLSSLITGHFKRAIIAPSETGADWPVFIQSKLSAPRHQSHGGMTSSKTADITCDRILRDVTQLKRTCGNKLTLESTGKLKQAVQLLNQVIERQIQF